MRYHTRSRRKFGIPYGGDVETPILKVLYKYRDVEDGFTKEQIAHKIREIEGNIIDSKSVGEALNRLYHRGCVKRRKYAWDRRRKEWRLRRTANVYREVEERIGIPTPLEHYPRYEERDYIDTISKGAVNLSPLKTALQAAVPSVAPPIEVGYLILSNLNTIRDVYNLTTATSSDAFKHTLNKTVKDATQLAHTQIAGFIAQPMSDTVITNIVGISSKYLEQKEIFKDITESFDLTDPYEADFMKFYETALSNFLRNDSDDHTG